jgi:PAS domain S-box-containing protein
LTSTLKEKRKYLVLLRGTMIVAVGGMLLGTRGDELGLATILLLAAFAVSNVLLRSAPLRWMDSRRFEILLGGADIVLVVFGVGLAGDSGRVLPLSCVLMLLVVALGNRRFHTITAATGVGALHASMVVGAESSTLWLLAAQVLFLCSVAVYYAYLVADLKRSMLQNEIEQLGRQELLTLIEILDSISATTDLRDLFRTVLTKINEVVPTRRCSVLFLNEAGTRCYVMASNDDPNVHMLELNLEKYPEVRRAIETRDPVVIDNVSTNPVVAQVREILLEADIRSVAVIPLQTHNQVLGALCLKLARSDGEFTQREVNFCLAVARASANAMQMSSQRHRLDEKLSGVLDHSPDLILTTDRQGRITELGRGAQALLGHPREEVLGRPYGRFFGQARAAGLVERIRREGSISNYNCQLKKPDGSEATIEFNMAPLTDETGEVTGTVWVGRDVTELREAQDRLIQTEKLSSMGEVVAGVAHELNNPLSGVLGFSQLLLMQDPDSPMMPHLEKINASARRCQKIVKNLLSFARRDKLERKYLGLNGILRKTLDLKRYQLQINNIEVVCELDPELPCTLLDFHQMQQVFLNLLNNAEQAILAGSHRPGRLAIRTSHEDGVIRAEIVDNGTGMDQACLRRAFDPFFTTKEKGQGTGLGLSVSYGIVREHGGSLWAESRKGEGARFVVEVPAMGDGRERSDESAPEDPVASAAGPAGARVLVVDDEPVILDLLISTFGDAGYRVDTANSGTEAAEKIRSRRFDVVVTDVQMPRMSGMELYREILSIHPDMEGRVVFMTGDLVNRETVQFLAGMNTRAILKPFDISEMLNAVREALEEPTCA